jgi:predicted HNH restriction endonuclease
MEERRKKAVENRDKSKRLQEAWNIEVVQSRYSDTGNWYAHLKKFPAALFDANGYLLVNSEEEYKSSTYLKKGKELSINKPGISAIPGYIRFPEQTPEPDIDIHALSVSEGNSKLVTHLQRERNQTIIKAKKKHAKSFDCEICGFSFERVYGGKAKDYCEVHHLIQLSEAEDVTETRIKDLAILCSNCHRVVHLRNPPFTLKEVKSMIAIE